MLLVGNRVNLFNSESSVHFSFQRLSIKYLYVTHNYFQDQASPMASPSTPLYPKHSDSLHSLSGHHSAGGAGTSDKEPPKFKYKMIMVHLPFDQHSRVEVSKKFTVKRRK